MLFTSFCFLGIVVAALHYQQVKTSFHQVPVPILIGQPNTNKTFLSKVTVALLGLSRDAVFNDLTMAKSVDLLGKSLFFVFNDPSNADVLKTLITKVSQIRAR
jgi:hypothetical protein